MTPVVRFALAACMANAPFGILSAQQVADSSFRPAIERPAYARGKGPVVLVDEAHRNFHTSTRRYRPFADLLRRDGYVVRASRTRFTASSLKAGRILVVANATAPDATTDATVRAASAFEDDEIGAVRDWVAQGGSLLLIVDHEPWNLSAQALGDAFAIRFGRGMVRRLDDPTGRLVFRKSDGTLAEHPITAGLSEVATFAGVSIEVQSPAEPLLVFGDGTYSFAGAEDRSPVVARGRAQGAVLRSGKGRVAVFGEAAMFTAQLSGPDRHPMGMNATIARDNVPFILNLAHWLSEAK